MQCDSAERDASHATVDSTEEDASTEEEMVPVRDENNGENSSTELSESTVRDESADKSTAATEGGKKSKENEFGHAWKLKKPKYINCSFFIDCSNIDTERLLDYPSRSKKLCNTTVRKIPSHAPLSKSQDHLNCSRKERAKETETVDNSSSLLQHEKEELPEKVELDFSKSAWENLISHSYQKNGKIYLPPSWTETVTEEFHKIKNFHCCLKYKGHYVPKKEDNYLFSCTFRCTIGGGGCKMHGKAILNQDFKLVVTFECREVYHEKGLKDSYKARYIRQPQRNNVAKELSTMKSPSKMWHNKLADLSNDDLEKGYLKNMANSKNVYKTIKCEDGKSTSLDRDLIQSVLKLK